jgi:hypothetical protein
MKIDYKGFILHNPPKLILLSLLVLLLIPKTSSQLCQNNEYMNAISSCVGCNTISTACMECTDENTCTVCAIGFNGALCNECAQGYTGTGCATCTSEYYNGNDL